MAWAEENIMFFIFKHHPSPGGAIYQVAGIAEGDKPAL